MFAKINITKNNSKLSYITTLLPRILEYRASYAHKNELKKDKSLIFRCLICLNKIFEIIFYSITLNIFFSFFHQVLPALTVSSPTPFLASLIGIFWTRALIQKIMGNLASLSISLRKPLTYLFFSVCPSNKVKRVFSTNVADKPCCCSTA